MKWDVAKKAIDFLKEHSQNAENWHIGFYCGEPLLNFELIEIIFGKILCDLIIYQCCICSDCKGHILAK